MSSLLIQNGLLIDTEWKRRADILVRGSKIVRIAAHIDPASITDNVTVIHADGLLVLPGVIDAHTHYKLVSRGTVTCDGFKEGSKAASHGGVTTVIDFADDDKVSLVGSLRSRINDMGAGMGIDFALHQGVYAFRPGLKDELASIKAMGCRAIKLFTTYKDVGYLVDDRNELKEIFRAARDLGLMVSVHSEDDWIITQISSSWKGTYTPSDHADMRPPEAEAAAIEYVGGIAGELDMPIYIVHLSSKKGLESVRKLRMEGVKVIVETTPHYLFLTREKLVGPDGPLYVMTPPLRTEEDNEALQEALLNGEIQVVATDHCSFTREQKLESNDCRTIYPGIPGTEEMLPLLHTFGVTSGRLSLSQIVNLLSTGPAKIFGLYPEKGSLEVGTDADITLFNPDISWTLSKDTIHSASGYTAYEGFSVTGKVVMTYLRGRLVMGDGIYLGLRGDGKFLRSKR